MWRPERKPARGPERATKRDVEALNDVFAASFTDRYRRDGLAGVRVPHLNPEIWHYAIEDAAEGAMIWRDAEGEIVAFNMVHRSGAEGWMGPLAVRPDRQNEGLGKAVVHSGVEWLIDQGVATVGLETMPRTVENIGFYSRLGFMPGHTTVTVVRDVARRRSAPGSVLADAGSRRQELVAECRALTDRLAPGTDYTREIDLTTRLGIGDTSLVRRGRGGRVAGFALWHAAPLAAARPREELRVLKLVAEDLRTVEALLVDVQARCHAARMRRVSVRCQTRFGEAYRLMFDLNFHAHWTDLRMTLHSHPEVIPTAGIVFSNWEI